MKNEKAFVSIILVFVAVLLYSGKAAAVGASIENVYLDGIKIQDTGVNGITSLERGEEFTLKVEVRASEPVSDAQIEAQIVGIHNEDVSDTTDTFDMKANVTYIKSLKLTLPDRTDQDRYRLRVRVEDRSGSTEQKDYMIQIEPARNLLTIKDVIFNPENEVKAGRSLLTTVRIKNMGDKDEEGMKIRVSIPELGVAVSDVIDELETEESTSSEELYLRIPQCSEKGDYDVVIEVTYDDGDKTTRKTESIKVLEDETCGLVSGGQQPSGDQTGQAKTSIVVPQSRDVVKGTGGTAYPITITNSASTSQTFTLSTVGVDTWGAYTFDPSNVLVVPAKGTATAFLYMTANSNAVEGRHSFALTVATSQATESIPLEANVMTGAAGGYTSSADGSLRRGLEIGLIVLVILLVILGLVIAFTKMKESDERSDGRNKEEKYY